MITQFHSDFSQYYFSGNCCTLQINVNFYEHLERNMHLKVYLGKVKDYIEKNTLAYTKLKRAKSPPWLRFPYVYMDN